MWVIAFAAEQSSGGRMVERHKAILRAMKAWAWNVGRDPGYAERVPLTDALADGVIEFVIENDLLHHFDRPDDPQVLKRRALERAERRHAQWPNDKPRLSE
jgi:hypothetical protein